eukprot:991977-Pyramimonas_sp.AAC.1
MTATFPAMVSCRRNGATRHCYYTSGRIGARGVTTVSCHQRAHRGVWRDDGVTPASGCVA